MGDQQPTPGPFPQFLFLSHILDSAEIDVSSFTDLFNDPNAAHFRCRPSITRKRRPRRKYLAAPEKFSGSEQDIAKRQDQYTAFRSAVNRCLTADYENESEFQKITFLASLLSGPAYTNNQIYFDTITDNPHDSDLWPLGWRTVTSIWHELNKQYQTLDLSRKASMDYDKCEMKKTPFGNFITEFKQLAIKCKKTAEQQVADLKLKVSQELIDASVNRPNKPSAADIDAWTVWVARNLRRFGGKNPISITSVRIKVLILNRDQSKLNEKKPVATSATITPDPSNDPMQLDAVRQSQHTPSRYTRDQCLDLGLCLYCKKPGHIKTNCEEKRLNDAKYNTNSGTTLYPNRPPTTNQYAPNTHRFPVTNHYHNPGPYRNAYTPSYQNTSPTTTAPFRYASPAPTGSADLGGFVEGSVHSNDSGNSIPQPGMLKE
ncbi:hypothetical protein DID88_002107 [Monilinia fructigena]|uniref:CCHC-type domain-containing protein n=1 Tax=Monilinia fructigena TaxID=38457 RepID=A0A395IV86_9HELO|nr:hypothetical protein DID88_002107 [Monilinia fructigena]